MTKLYIAAELLLGSVADYHYYLIKDPNDDPNSLLDETIIRGGPLSGPSSPILITADLPLTASPEGESPLVPANLRFYTELNLNGHDPAVAWGQMADAAQHFGISNGTNYSTKIPYAYAFLDSNSTVRSVLSAVGIDVFANMPILDTGTGQRMTLTNAPGLVGIYGPLSDGAIDARTTAVNGITNIVRDQGGNTTIKIATNNEYDIYLDDDFATKENLQIQGIELSRLQHTKYFSDLLLVDKDNPSDVIATIKDYYSASSVSPHGFDSVQEIDNNGQPTGIKFRITHDALDQYNWNEIQYAFTPGADESALTSLDVTYDDNTTSSKTFGSGASSVTTGDLQLVSQAAYCTGNLLHAQYGSAQTLGTLTAEQAAGYKAQVLELAGRAEALFVPYLAVDGSATYTSTESFIQAARGWTNGIVGDFSGSSADRALVGTLEQNLLAMYDGLTTTASGLVSGTPYAGMTALVSQLMVHAAVSAYYYDSDRQE